MARFTKHHYEEVASTLAALRPPLDGYSDPREGKAADDQYKSTIERFAKMFKADNPKFSEAKFIEWVMFGGPSKPGKTPRGNQTPAPY